MFRFNFYFILLMFHNFPIIWKYKLCKSLIFQHYRAYVFGAPGGIRTPGLQVRSLIFYPAKLQAHFLWILLFFYFCLFLFASFTCSIILWFFFLFKSFLEFFEFFFKISCQIIFFVVYYISVQVISRCSAVGSARGLGPWGRRFDPCHLDHKKSLLQETVEGRKLYQKCIKYVISRDWDNVFFLS